MKNVITLVVFLFCFLPTIHAASIEKAGLLKEHGLTDDSKRELINVIFDEKSTDNDKATAFYILGNIAFEENKTTVALNSWSYLAKKYPKSYEAGLVDDRIAELSESTILDSKELIDNVQAIAYLKYAEFWSESRKDAFGIDTSYIPKMDASIKWYDKVIIEFPNSKAAQIAYEGKLKTLLGAQLLDPESSTYYLGSVFEEHLSRLIQTFKDYEKEYPDVANLQAYRYQIAQIYWTRSKRSEPGIDAIISKTAKEWFEMVIEKAGTHDSFYRDLAQRRLKNFNWE